MRQNEPRCTPSSWLTTTLKGVSSPSFFPSFLGVEPILISIAVTQHMVQNGRTISKMPVLVQEWAPEDRNSTTTGVSIVVAGFGKPA